MVCDNDEQHSERVVEAMTASKPKLTRAQRLLVYDRVRELERRAPVDVRGEMLAFQAQPDFDETCSRLPHARPRPPRAEVTAQTRRAADRAAERADRKASARRSQLAAIAAGVMPGSEAWETWRQRWLAAQGI